MKILTNNVELNLAWAAVGFWADQLKDNCDMQDMNAVNICVKKILEAKEQVDHINEQRRDKN